MSDTAPKSWYHDDQGKPITFKQTNANFRATITVTHEQFQNLIDCASRGCKTWADELKINKFGFRVREVRGHGKDEYTYHWCSITPRKLAAIIARVSGGESFEHLNSSSAAKIRDLWLNPPLGVDHLNRYIDDDMANNLVQLVCFGKLVYD